MSDIREKIEKLKEEFEEICSKFDERGEIDILGLLNCIREG